MPSKTINKKKKISNLKLKASLSWEIIPDDNIEIRKKEKFSSFLLSENIQNFDIEFEAPISNNTRSVIIKLLKESGFKPPSSNHLMENYGYNEFDWRWKSEKGNLTKRIALWSKKEKKQDLPEDLIKEIGNICQKEVKKSDKYYLTVSDQPARFGIRNKKKGSFYLGSGFFGQGTGSCWWSNAYASDGKQQWQWFYEWGGYVLLLYSEPSRLCSDIGRAWAFNYNENCIIVCNGKHKGHYESNQLFVDLISSLLPDAVETKVISINYGRTAALDNIRVGLYDEVVAVAKKGHIEEVPADIEGWFTAKDTRWNTRVLPDYCKLEKQREELVKKYKDWKKVAGS